MRWTKRYFSPAHAKKTVLNSIDYDIIERVAEKSPWLLKNCIIKNVWGDNPNSRKGNITSVNTSLPKMNRHTKASSPERIRSLSPIISSRRLEKNMELKKTQDLEYIRSLKMPNFVKHNLEGTSIRDRRIQQAWDTICMNVHNRVSHMLRKRRYFQFSQKYCKSPQPKPRTQLDVCLSNRLKVMQQLNLKA